MEPSSVWECRNNGKREPEGDAADGFPKGEVGEDRGIFRPRCEKHHPFAIVPTLRHDSSLYEEKMLRDYLRLFAFLAALLDLRLALAFAGFLAFFFTPPPLGAGAPP